MTHSLNSTQMLNHRAHLFRPIRSRAQNSRPIKSWHNYDDQSEEKNFAHFSNAHFTRAGYGYAMCLLAFMQNKLRFKYYFSIQYIFSHKIKCSSTYLKYNWESNSVCNFVNQISLQIFDHSFAWSKTKIFGNSCIVDIEYNALSSFFNLIFFRYPAV